MNKDIKEKKGIKDIEEEDILNFLSLRKEMLIEELQKLDATIEVLNSTKSLLLFNKDSILKNSSNSHNEEHIDNSHNREIPYLIVPDKYDPDSTLNKKIAYALSKIKLGSKEDIIEYIVSKEPDINKNKLSANLSVRLSSHLKNGKIRAEKKGRRYIYFL